MSLKFIFLIQNFKKSDRNVQNQKMIQQKSNILEKQVQQICNMCITLGIHKNVYQGQNRILTHMPVSYFPYQIFQSTYLKLQRAHYIWAKLLLKVSKDKQFVNKVFHKTAQHDQFVNKYLILYNKYIQDQTYGVSCLRVDYMGDQNPQLVEFNLMSVGLNGMSDAVQKLASLRKKQNPKIGSFYYPNNSNQVALLNAIQKTLSMQGIKGLALMLVHQKNQKQFNLGDQNAFQLEALNRKLKVQRCSLTELISNYSLNQKGEFYYGEYKVALVYFRTAYSPSHYLTQQHWKIRQIIQKADVLSIPSVSMQLINFKRMQVQLSKIEILKNYLDEDQATLIKSLCGQIYDCQDQNQLQKLKNLAHSNNYILKSNRQGGGNNYFCYQAAKKFDQLSGIDGQLQKYILMKKIKSDIRENIFIANYQYKQVQSTCQYSTMGSFAYMNNDFIHNQCGGSLVRLKRAEQNQGGIAVDKAVIAGFCVVTNSQNQN